MDGVTVLPYLPVRWITKLRFFDNPPIARVEGRDTDGVMVTYDLPEAAVRERLRMAGRSVPHGTTYVDASSEPWCTDPIPEPIVYENWHRGDGTYHNLSDILDVHDGGRFRHFDSIVAFEDYGDGLLDVTEQCDMNFGATMTVADVRKLAAWLTAWADAQGPDAPTRVIPGPTRGELEHPVVAAARKVLNISEEHDALVMNWDPEPIERAATKPVVDLMAALEASVKAAKDARKRS